MNKIKELHKVIVELILSDLEDNMKTECVSCVLREIAIEISRIA